MGPRQRIGVSGVWILLTSGAVAGQSLHLDPAFGTGGKLVDTAAGFQRPYAVHVQPDGKILVGGTDFGTSTTFAITRYLLTGAPDPSFVPASLPNMQKFRGMALQPDGKIVAVGTTGANFGIVRLLPGGSPDTTFDGDGHESVDFLGGADSAEGVAIQSDGKIVVSGVAWDGQGRPAPAVARLLSNGNLDPMFGTGGKALGPVTTAIGIGTGDGPRKVLIDSLGRIVFQIAPSLGPVRFLSNGNVDASFGSAGVATLPGPFEFWDISIALAPDDRLLVVGQFWFNEVDSQWYALAILRLTDTGAVDTIFGNGGMATIGLGHIPVGRAAVALPDGRFYVAGMWDQNFFLGRFHEDGSLDTTFGVDGYQLTPFPFGAEPYDLTVGGGGEVVIAGWTDTLSETALALARYETCGAPSLPPPTLASVTPAEIPVLGGAVVQIAGSGLDPLISVRVGETFGWIVGVPSVDVVEAQVSHHPIGLIDVTVENPDCQRATLADAVLVYPLDVVPPYNPFVKRLIRNRVTAGCEPFYYCSRVQVTRAQMAVFLLRSKEGPSYLPPPATGTVFADVPIDGFAASWIEELARRKITGGCDVNLYCPDAFNTRAQMAVLLLVTLEGTGYQPPDPSGIFLDVPVSSPYARWIEELYVRGITGGCAQGLYCPEQSVLREQMAVFLSVTFNLPG